MPSRELIVPPGFEALVQRFHYAPAVRVGDTLYVSGQVGRRLDASGALVVVEDKDAQIEQAFANLGAVLDHAGFTFGDIVELETWLLDFPGDLPRVMKAKDRFLGDTVVAWTGFGVANFSMPGLCFEVKATAIKGA